LALEVHSETMREATGATQMLVNVKENGETSIVLLRSLNRFVSYFTVTTKIYVPACNVCDALLE
jgi:hypothetical protein